MMISQQQQLQQQQPVVMSLNNPEDEVLVSPSSPREAATIFPKTVEDAERVDDILASEMEKLSMEERDKLIFDIHGFSDDQPEEEEATINELLENMNAEINKLRGKDVEAYLQAKYLNEDYVTGRAFRLMFLRSERYDPRFAAERFITHFAIKRDLFGSGEILGRDIRLVDLSEDDMETLESGFIQMLPSRDGGGRTVIALAPTYRRCKMIENTDRALWYFFMTNIRRDEDIQKKGFVVIVYNQGKPPNGLAEEIAFVRSINHLRRGIPKKLQGCHFCGLDPSLRVFISGICLFMPKELRKRLKQHVGSYTEVSFKLQTFGINADHQPLQEDGSLSLMWHQEWLRMCKAQEEEKYNNNSSNPLSNTILVPRRFDVLFGRGKATREHTGNLRAAHLVQMHEQEYENANRFEKTTIALRIMTIVHESCGRFLKWEDQGWVEVDDEAARDKISHFFRQNRVNKKKNPPAEEVPSNSTANNVDLERTLASNKRESPCPPSPDHPMDVEDHVGGDEKATKRQYRDPEN